MIFFLCVCAPKHGAYNTDKTGNKHYMPQKTDTLLHLPTQQKTLHSCLYIPLQSQLTAHLAQNDSEWRGPGNTALDEQVRPEKSGFFSFQTKVIDAIKVTGIQLQDRPFLDSCKKQHVFKCTGTCRKLYKAM